MSLLNHWRRLDRALATLVRTYKSQASLRPVPAVRGNITSPAAFLKCIGRGAEEKLDVGDWRQFWRMGGSELRAANVDTKDRKYILWAMEKFRQGYDPKDFAYPPKPKKKIRGWGPAVQLGKRIRSRRKQ